MQDGAEGASRPQASTCCTPSTVNHMVCTCMIWVLGPLKIEVPGKGLCKASSRLDLKQLVPTGW